MDQNYLRNLKTVYVVPTLLSLNTIYIYELHKNRTLINRPRRKRSKKGITGILRDREKHNKMTTNWSVRSTNLTYKYLTNLKLNQQQKKKPKRKERNIKTKKYENK